MAHSPYTVGDLMTRAVVAIGQEARFKEIVEVMERWQVSALPVLAGRAGWSVWSPRRICCPRKSSGGAAEPAGAGAAAGRRTQGRRADGGGSDERARADRARR
ncbi:hypothetical protein Srufu_073240 [Streptomyces libani subsp. rufus]|nr:hypothetical protein Srufu_073240 [Streptomyces libani subsp. rufus]